MENVFGLGIWPLALIIGAVYTSLMMVLFRITDELTGSRLAAIIVVSVTTIISVYMLNKVVDEMKESRSTRVKDVYILRNSDTLFVDRKIPAWDVVLKDGELNVRRADTLRTFILKSGDVVHEITYDSGKVVNNLVVYN